jgi:hypothetical protein
LSAPWKLFQHLQREGRLIISEDNKIAIAKIIKLKMIDIEELINNKFLLFGYIFPKI